MTLGFLGFISFEDRVDLIAAFVVIAVVSVLIHEFGHAFAARSQGTVGTPVISLTGMAGLTRYRLAKTPSRVQSIFISFAGPLTGIVLGFGILALRSIEPVEETVFVENLYWIGLFTTFGWSAFNLVPIVPLDGGHIMTDLLPGNSLERRRRAAWVSIAVAAILAPVLWFSLKLLFAPIILAAMAFQNWSSLKNLPSVPHPTTTS